MSTTLTPGGTKICPQCAEEIKLDALLCRYCRQRFEVAHVGYCGHCHAVVPAGEDETCSSCGGALVDVRTQSAPVEGDAASPTEPAPRPAPEPERAEPGRVTRSIVPTRIQHVAYRTNWLAAWVLALLVLVQLFAKSQADSATRSWDPPRWIFLATRDVAPGYEYLLIPALLAPAIAGLAFGPWRLRPRTRLLGRLGKSEYRRKVESQRRKREESRREFGVPGEFGAAVLFRAKWFRSRLVVAGIVWLAGLGYLVFQAATLKTGYTLEPFGYAEIGLSIAGALSVVALLIGGPKRAVRVDEWGVIHPPEP